MMIAMASANPRSLRCRRRYLTRRPRQQNLIDGELSPRVGGLHSYSPRSRIRHALGLDLEQEILRQPARDPFALHTDVVGHAPRDGRLAKIPDDHSHATIGLHGLEDEHLLVHLVAIVFRPVRSGAVSV